MNIEPSYHSLKTYYEELTRFVEIECRRLAESLGFKDCLLSSRTKEKESLLKKFKTKGYSRIEDFPDISGVRIVLEDDLQLREFTELVIDSFEIKWDHVALNRHKINEIGYSSRHLVVQLTNSQMANFNGNLKGLKCEIQIRTLLSHSWAQLQRKLDLYKAETKSKFVQRKVNLISATLDMIDKELLEIRRFNELINSETKDDEVAYLFSSEAILNICRKIKNHNNISVNLQDSQDQIVKIYDILRGRPEIEQSCLELIVIDHYEEIAEILNWQKMYDIQFVAFLLLCVAASITSKEESISLINSLPYLTSSGKKEFVEKFRYLKFEHH